MTPSAHATAASDLLASTRGSDHDSAKVAKLAAVHAVLSTKTGSGGNYTAAEAELTTGTLDSAAGYHLDRALAFALLAS